jgi:hypothetical protein
MNALLFKRHGISGGACLCLLIGAATGAQAAKDPDATSCVSTKVCPRHPRDSSSSTSTGWRPVRQHAVATERAGRWHQSLQSRVLQMIGCMSCLGLLGTTRRPEVVSAMVGRSLDLPRNGHFVPSGAS